MLPETGTDRPLVTSDETAPAAHANASPAPTKAQPRRSTESGGASSARTRTMIAQRDPDHGDHERTARSTRSGTWFTRRRLVVIGSAAALLSAAGVTAAVLTAPPGPDVISISQALTVIGDGDVTSATLQDAASTVTLTTAEGARLEARYPDAYADEVTDLLVTMDVPLTTESGEKSIGAQLVLTTVPLLLILCVLVFAMRAVNPNRVFANNKKALTSGEIPSVTFADVAGADEAVDQLQEMVQFLREPDRFEAVGATRPRGALLVGPPGTGKTLLARAVAGEAQVPFFALAGSDFVETFVGVGARRVRDLFAQARKAERAIIFIDEIDAVGRTRSAGSSNGGDGERENTLISLLNEMDGFAGSNIIVLAATNRADTLDPALTRPGRLDRQVQVPNPDRRGRTLILQVHGASRPLATDVDFVTVARQTPGMSGADLAQVVNEACMEAARRGQPTVDASCFQAAVATVAMGRARTSALVTEYDRRITAWHEAGHTLAAALLPDADDPVSVTIVPRGAAGGVTWMSGNDDVFLPRKKALARLVVALAGRAAEEYLLDGEHTQGASSDLQNATNLATAMVTQYGMTDFGYAQIDTETLRVGGHVAAQAHARIDGLLREAHVSATELLTRNGAVLEALATALLAEETLSAGRVRQIVTECQDATRSDELHPVHGLEVRSA
jgi:cell division protease FtsH